MQNYKNWTTEEDNLLRQVANGTSSYNELAIKYFPERSAQSLQGHAISLGISSKYKSRLYYQDDNFWSMPNKINAYWAGIAMADCCITKDSRDGMPQSFVWQCSTKDEDMMLNFMKDCRFTGKIRHETRVTKSGYDSQLSAIYINSAQWLEDLKNNFNIGPCKAARICVPDTINEELFPYIIRGFIDGDGCIHHNIRAAREYKKGKMKEQENLVIQFISSGKEMIKWIKEFCDQRFYPERNKPLVVHEKDNYSILAINGQRAIQMFLYLYSLDTYVLKRKWENPNILNYIRRKIKERPQAYEKFIGKFKLEEQELIDIPPTNLDNPIIETQEEKLILTTAT